MQIKGSNCGKWKSQLGMAQLSICKIRLVRTDSNGGLVKHLLANTVRIRFKKLPNKKEIQFKKEILVNRFFT